MKTPDRLTAVRTGLRYKKQDIERLWFVRRLNRTASSNKRIKKDG
jgi:hypothetical protein